MNTQDENRDTLQTSAYNPFPEPQTIPAGWDTSMFFSTPQTVAVTEADDSIEMDSESRIQVHK
jgi:hypothetical protein